MKIKKGILGLLALVGVISLVGCNMGGGGTSKAPTPTPTSVEPVEPTTTSTTAPAPTFEAFTLEQLHEARKAKTLGALDQKFITVKGKVTFAKRVSEYASSIFIQNGKYGLEVNYPEPFNVNVGDSVEVKGRFGTYQAGDIVTIELYTDSSVSSYCDIKVINEAINVETVTIRKMADLIEYDSSKAVIDFSVVGNRTNAAFIGKLLEGDDQIIVAPKSHLGDKFEEAPYVAGDKVRYTGVFTFSGDSSARVMRYFGATTGFEKLAS